MPAIAPTLGRMRDAA